MLKLIFAAFVLSILTGCTFNFDVTSQRTALENQVMGSYKELDDDLILISSVRSPDANPTADVSPSKARALDARQNQQFNRDDVDELKDKEVLGETAGGELALLPKGVGHGTPTPAEETLAHTLVAEENRDRAEIWRRIIAANQNLSEKDLPEVRRTYAKLQREDARPGNWIQDESGRWSAKPGAESLK